MKAIDLTLKIKDGMRAVPFLPRVVIDSYLTHSFTQPLYKSPCQGVAMTSFSMVDHCGTHIDAPRHFIPGGKDISEIEPGRLIGKAVLIDASSKSPEEPLTKEMLQDFMHAQEVEINAGDIVVIRLWPKKWGDEGYFSCKPLALSAAEFLLGKKAKLLGVDTYTVDCPEDKQRPVHMKLLANELLPVEALVNLEQIRSKRFEFIALPLPLENGSGSPVRAIAVVD
ncbi:MAG: cyclase family protein [Dethiobacteria bacterium]|jgi:arylformamidase|nr:cyclase family protein [Bacillota bacterium]